MTRQATIVNLYKAGLPVVEIAHKVGISTTAVHANIRQAVDRGLCQRRGQVRSPLALEPSTVEAVRSGHRTVQEVADSLQCSRRSVQRALRRAGHPEPRKE